MHSILSLDDILAMPSTITVRGEGKMEFAKYLHKLVVLLRRKLTEGSILDAQKITQELKNAFKGTKQLKVTISPALEAEVELYALELQVKIRNHGNKTDHLTNLREILGRLTKNERQSVVFKVNCMILFDAEFAPFQEHLQHDDRLGVILYKKGNFAKSLQVFQKNLTSKPVEYQNIRRVWIGKVLMQSYDLSAFSWLYQVINNKPHRNSATNAKTGEHNEGIHVSNESSFRQYKTQDVICAPGLIQVYQAKVLFASGFKILCESKGKDPHIAGVTGLHNKTEQYLSQIQLMTGASKMISQFKKLKSYSSNCPESNKIQNLVETIRVLDKIPFHPKPSLQQLDLRIALSESLLSAKLFKEARRQTQICNQIGEDLGVLQWNRESVLTRVSASSYLKMQQPSVNSPQQSFLEEQEQHFQLLTKLEKLNDESTKLSSKSKHKTPLGLGDDNQKYIRIPPKLSYSNTLSIPDNRSQESHSEQEGKQNQIREGRSPSKRRPLNSPRNNYKYQRRAHSLEADQENSITTEPNCCLIF